MWSVALKCQWRVVKPQARENWYGIYGLDSAGGSYGESLWQGKEEVSLKVEERLPGVEGQEV